jgi:hypothetical protein
MVTPFLPPRAPPMDTNKTVKSPIRRVVFNRFI